MKVGSCWSSFCCIGCIDDELSTMNRRSISLLIFCVKVVGSVAVGVIVGASSVREVQAQSAGATAARAAHRRTLQDRQDERTGRWKRAIADPPQRERRRHLDQGAYRGASSI